MRRLTKEDVCGYIKNHKKMEDRIKHVLDLIFGVFEKKVVSFRFVGFSDITETENVGGKELLDGNVSYVASITCEDDTTVLYPEEYLYCFPRSFLFIEDMDILETVRDQKMFLQLEQERRQIEWENVVDIMKQLTPDEQRRLDEYYQKIHSVSFRKG